MVIMHPFPPWGILFGQIIAMSQDLTCKGSFAKEITLFSGKWRLVNIITWPDKYIDWFAY